MGKEMRAPKPKPYDPIPDALNRERPWQSDGPMLSERLRRYAAAVRCAMRMCENPVLIAELAELADRLERGMLDWRKPMASGVRDHRPLNNLPPPL